MTAVEVDIRCVEDILHPRGADSLVEGRLKIPLLDCVDLLDRSDVRDIDLVGSNSNDGA